VATSTTKAVATPVKSSGTGCSGKVGLAWSNHEASIIPQFITDKTCWIYDWTEDLQYGMKTDGLTFISMLWGEKNADAFQKKMATGAFSWAAGFNEPDISSQANMDAGTAASLWRQYLSPLKNEGITLLSPATAAGPSWLTGFVKECPDCKWDYTAVHVYTTTVSSFQTAVTAYKDFGAPVMVTEYACHDYSGKNQQCDSGDIWAFMQGTNGWMDSQDWIAGYFFFAPMTSSELESNNINGANALISSDGKSLTDLGKFYIGS